ncbi:hypothetical protein BH10PLA1_BH10PLA1_16670 [soil metagenome]
MSAITSVGPVAASYQPVARAVAETKTASKPAAPVTADRDHDGDTDGGGLDVKG